MPHQSMEMSRNVREIRTGLSTNENGCFQYWRSMVKLYVDHENGSLIKWPSRRDLGPEKTTRNF